MDQKNVIAAIVVSLIVILGYQYFYEAPRQRALQASLESQQQAAQSAQTANTQAPGAAPAQDAGAPNPETPGTSQPLAREAALALSPRVALEGSGVKGSVALKGGRIDDLILTGYRETIDPGSANIVLLSPVGTKGAYFADFGWWSPDSKLKLPNADTLWSVDKGQPASPQGVTLNWDNGQGLVFKRRIELNEDYLFTVTDTVAAQGTDHPIDLYSYSRITRFGTPEHASQTYVLHEGLIGVFDGTLIDDKLSYKKLRAKAEEKDPNQRFFTYSSDGGWLGITDKYWLVAAIVKNGTINARMLYEPKSDSYQADYTSAPQPLAPGATLTAARNLFAGAKKLELLDHYKNKYSIPLFDRAVDFGWYYFLTKPIFKLLDFLYQHIGNFGIAILILTIIIKSLMFPLANKSYRAMNRMKALNPQITAIRERYADDKAQLNQEVMALYKREKVNPAAGCLPVFVQIPVFFALYKVLYVTIEMRQAPFFGWIRDLSAPDPTSVFSLFGLVPWDYSQLFAIPLAGGIFHFLSIGIWPLIMGVTMWAQQRLNPTPPDPVQARLFAIMPIFFTFMLGKFASGLVIYWAWNNLLSIAQQRFLTWRMKMAAR